MSAETKEALAEAIQAHLADEWDGAYLTNWYLACTGEHLTNAKVTTYMFEHPTDVGPHGWLGLLTMARIHAEAELYAGSVDKEDTEDEDD